MKILVLSDSHSALSFMRKCVYRLRPDTVVHLGDHYADGQTLALENPHIPFHQVTGNCDRYQCFTQQFTVLCYAIGGVRFFMTHGHMHQVKSGIHSLLSAAGQAQAQAVLYGHTHQADCHREPDGTWVLNPGSCGGANPSAGLIEIENNQITDCRILRQTDLEEML